jgi:uncharacterized protein (TIGR03435 family)
MLLTSDINLTRIGVGCQQQTDRSGTKRELRLGFLYFASLAIRHEAGTAARVSVFRVACHQARSGNCGFSRGNILCNLPASAQYSLIMRAAPGGLLFAALLAQAASFEVATVRINQTGAVGDRENYHDGVLRMSNVTLRQCIRYAYEISEPQIVGGPKWIDEIRFDIVAKAEQPYPTDDFELLRMLKPLLAARFQLVAHHETRTLPGYALTLTKEGIQAKVSDPNTRFSGSSTRNTMTVTGCTMSTLAMRLSAVLKRPVADMTHESRSFDFSLRWTQDEMLPGENAASLDGPSLFTALREQLGVKVESGKLPVDALVIDRAEMPSEN